MPDEQLETSMVRAAPIGFDVTSRLWKQVSDEREAFVPGLDGELTIGREALDAASRDQGRELRRAPGVVLRPGSTRDVQRVVARCREVGIAVSAQGAGHSVDGQRLVQDGVAVDMTTLNEVGDVSPGLDSIDVQAGVMWSRLADLLSSRRVRFAGGLTGYLGLTVGGTLAVGGISNMPSKGAQVDATLGVEVVTGRGEAVWCTETENAELFSAALGGLGQVGLVTRARLALVPAPDAVRAAVVPYTGVTTALDAARTAIGTGRVDEVFIMVMPPAAGGRPVFNLHLAAYGDNEGSSFDGVLDRLPEWSNTENGAGTPQLNARRPAGSVQSLVQPYRAYVEQFTVLIDQWREQSGWDERRKPWFDAFLGDEAIDAFVEQTISEMTEEDWSMPHGGGFVLLFPHDRAAFTRPRLRLPAPTGNRLVWLFDRLNVSAPNADPSFTARMRATNERWMKRALAVGGTRYPIGAVTYDADDWRSHYGDTWPDVVRLKQRFDPAGILTPGPGIVTDL